MIIGNKHYLNAIKLHSHLLVLDGRPSYVTICWTSDGCDGQVDLKLHLSVGQVILFPYFDHCWYDYILHQINVVSRVLDLSLHFKQVSNFLHKILPENGNETLFAFLNTYAIAQ